MPTADTIRQDLNKSNNAVFRAILTLDDKKLFAVINAPLGRYYAAMIREGNLNSLTHIEAARSIALAHVMQLANPDTFVHSELDALPPKTDKGLLTMVRSGEFRITTYGPSHCGILEDLGIRYEMVAKCAPILDDRGFLFDQINVDNFFQSIKRSSLSCEHLCIDCANKLRKMIQQENPDCKVHSLDLKLSPEPFKASMTYSWQ